jgi:hypothetical protein
MSDFDEPSRRDWEQRRLRRKLMQAEDETEQMIDEAEQRTPLNPGWRRERTGRTRRRASSGAIYASPQEFQLWLQRGGWMWFAAAAAVVIFSLIFFLWQSRSDARDNTENSPFLTEAPPTPEGQEPGVFAPGEAEPAAPIQPTLTPEPAAPADTAPTTLEVFNTGTQGLFLRAEPNANATILETLPNGTRVEKIGEENIGANYVWQHVRAPSGQEGWAAADWLQPAP